MAKKKKNRAKKQSRQQTHTQAPEENVDFFQPSPKHNKITWLIFLFWALWVVFLGWLSYPHWEEPRPVYHQIESVGPMQAEDLEETIPRN